LDLGFEHVVTLGNETDFAGWRSAARRLAMSHVKPEDVSWRISGHEPDLLEELSASALPDALEGTFNVPAKFVELAQAAILHRDSQRFPILYRLLWRLRSHHDLLDIATDPDVAQVTEMTRAVHRDEHKMHTSVRFREIGRERQARYVAWFEPEHHIVELAAPFFARRFADMPWSILTPDLCAHWDGSVVSFTPGVSRKDAPSQDRIEDLWRRYYASIFNPARLKVKAMNGTMPALSKTSE
jgi:DNA polymerase